MILLQINFLVLAHYTQYAKLIIRITDSWDPIQILQNSENKHSHPPKTLFYFNSWKILYDYTMKLGESTII